MTGRLPKLPFYLLTHLNSLKMRVLLILLCFVGLATCLTGAYVAFLLLLCTSGGEFVMYLLYLLLFLLGAVGAGYLFCQLFTRGDIS